MSDTFDFEPDVREYFDRYMDEGYHPRRKRLFVQDPFYFHKWYDIDEVVTETPKALMIKFKGLNFWVPKSICAIARKKAIFAHETIFEIILEKALPPRPYFEED